MTADQVVALLMLLADLRLQISQQTATIVELRAALASSDALPSPSRPDERKA